PEKIELAENAPKPSLREGQMLVEVYAAGLNPVEASIRLGKMQEMLPLTLPITVGGDFSGIVAEIQQGNSEFKIGDEVFGSANHLKGGSGAVAEYVATSLKNTALKPKNISFNEAASLPLVGSSVVQ